VSAGSLLVADTNGGYVAKADKKALFSKPCSIIIVITKRDLNTLCSGYALPSTLSLLSLAICSAAASSADIVPR